MFLFTVNIYSNKHLNNIEIHMFHNPFHCPFPGKANFFHVWVHFFANNASLICKYVNQLMRNIKTASFLNILGPQCKVQTTHQLILLLLSLWTKHQTKFQNPEISSCVMWGLPCLPHCVQGRIKCRNDQEGA